MKEQIINFLKEAGSGKIIVDNDEWNIGFNSIINNQDKKINFYNEKNNSTLIIKDINEFINNIELYINEELKKIRKMPKFIEEESKIKWILLYLFSNATTEDFLNINEYIKRRIEFLRDKTFDYLEKPLELELSDNFFESTLIIKKEINPISMETPYKISLTLKDKNNDEFILPSIYYGISREKNEIVCYIYSIMNDSKQKYEQKSKYKSKINRLLYKINDGIEFDVNDEENIKDVSMSFMLSANIFASLLQKEGIIKTKVVSFLPIRYLSRDNCAINNEELQKRNEKIQENMTNKLTRTFKRLTIQNEDINIESYPYELDEYLSLKVSKKNKESSNILLEETSKIVNNKH